MKGSKICFIMFRQSKKQIPDSGRDHPHNPGYNIWYNFSNLIPQIASNWAIMFWSIQKSQCNIFYLLDWLITFQFKLWRKSQIKWQLRKSTICLQWVVINIWNGNLATKLLGTQIFTKYSLFKYLFTNKKQQNNSWKGVLDWWIAIFLLYRIIVEFCNIVHDGQLVKTIKSRGWNFGHLGIKNCPRIPTTFENCFFKSPS